MIITVYFLIEDNKMLQFICQCRKPDALRQPNVDSGSQSSQRGWSQDTSPWLTDIAAVTSSGDIRHECTHATAGMYILPLQKQTCKYVSESNFIVHLNTRMTSFVPASTHRLWGDWPASELFRRTAVMHFQQHYFERSFFFRKGFFQSGHLAEYCSYVIRHTGRGVHACRGVQRSHLRRTALLSARVCLCVYSINGFSSDSCFDEDAVLLEGTAG